MERRERKNSTALSMDGITLIIQRNVSHCRIKTKRMVKNPVQKRNRDFQPEKFCKEINMLAKKSSKKEVLDSFATVLAQERAKMKKQEQKRRVIEEDSDSDSDISINVLKILLRKKSGNK